MANSATIYKAVINITDMDRNYYAEHALTIACHPSESESRMMVRLLAFILNATPDLQFSRGLSSQDEPALWVRNEIDETLLWIDIGQPDEKRIRQACQRAKQVIIYTYQPRSVAPWLKQVAHKLSRFDNLTIRHLEQTTVDQLGSLAKRTMKLQCTLQDGELWINDDSQQLQITLPRDSEGSL
nr:YaeQ family protein [Gammaproteobacteria bacterium]MCF6230797.1 YaeQ family protein [Gammaproteobacteria bacterium]